MVVVDVVEVLVVVVLVDVGGGCVGGMVGATVGGTVGGGVSEKGAGAFDPFNTYTGVPDGRDPKIQSAEFIGTRTQPCEAGPPGTESAPWMAMLPLKYDGL